MRRLYPLICCVLVIACAPPPEREISVAMTEYAFMPATIEVATGERVRLVIRNTGRLEHDFATDERGRALGVTHLHLAPGVSSYFDWTAPAEPTEVRVICTIAGHESLGMVARLIVRPRATAAPSTSP